LQAKIQKLTQKAPIPLEGLGTFKLPRPNIFQPTRNIERNQLKSYADHIEVIESKLAVILEINNNLKTEVEQCLN
jgi:hypothetical protein